MNILVPSLERWLHPYARIRALEAERELLIARCMEVLRQRDLAAKAWRESTEMLRESNAELEATRRELALIELERGRELLGKTVGRA